jgi:hypothetical protein
VSAPVDVLETIRAACDRDALPYEVHVAVHELKEAARALGELVHTWRETGVPPNLRELAQANERNASSIARIGGAK